MESLAHHLFPKYSLYLNIQQVSSEKVIILWIILWRDDLQLQGGFSSSTPGMWRSDHSPQSFFFLTMYIIQKYRCTFLIGTPQWNWNSALA